MTRLRGPIAVTAAAALFLLAACARPDGVSGAADTDAAGATPPAGDTLVLRVRQEGGFVPPERIVGRIPTYSLYADGRIITEGPVPLIYPGPALPNVQVRQIDPAGVPAITDRAVQAGVRTGTEFGRPGVADAPTTRIDVVTADGAVQSVSAEGLTEAPADDPMLTADQKAARARLAAFVRELSEPDGAGADRPYRAEKLAALAQPYVAPEDGLTGVTVPKAWPGPELPGEYLNPNVKVGCVVATGAQLDEILAAAPTANANTPWTSGGNEYRVTFRPLLPDEDGCADLKAAR